ncbi:hypothetical protein [Thalassomonas actiniarum]|uniref:Uncharacterized protein n=1 Tax=Thalassomonas actiniarum TaxID=485447 RepID=A0AAF0C619_9GAMM|nr:hypothetical protein [Thalassomonas actiniarum]WDE02128.1 hypothetical protein SG35_030675 [Thalassomonas actiniarum]
MEKIYDVEIIKWAFEKGYNLGHTDIQDGIHINFTEIQKHFLNELAEYKNEEGQLDSSAITA